MVGEVTVPLGVLAIYIVWTIAVVVMLLGARRKFLAAGGDSREFSIPNGDNLIWRLFRAQVNLVENLPLYAGVVLILSIRGITGGTADALALIYIVFRVAHSVLHVLGFYAGLRLACLIVQFICLIGLVLVAIQ